MFIYGNDEQKSGSEKTVRISRFKAADIAETALMTALITVCTWISVPADVPFTLQTFGVFTAAGLLGMKKGTLSVVVYVLLGAVGAPVFAGFKGGLGAMAGVTGGYIIGFVFQAFITGFFVDKWGKKLYVMCIGMFFGLLACYAFGTAWFMLLYIKNSEPVGLAAVLGKCVVPFIIPDIIKGALAVTVIKAVSAKIKIKG